MTISTVDLQSSPLLLSTALFELFGTDYKQLAKVYDKIFDVETTDKNFEDIVDMYGIGIAEKKAEGAMVQASGYAQNNAKRVAQETWAQRVRITMEAYEDQRHIKQMPLISKELAKAINVAREISCAAFFNNATSTSAPYVGADGKAMIATDHPLANGDTYSNKPSTDLDISEAVLEQAVIDIQNFKNNEGIKISVEPDRLIIPNALQFEVNRILKSMGRVGVADNDLNALKSLGYLQKDPLIWKYLTDSDSWFIMTDVAQGFVMYQRKAPTIKSFNDDHTLDYNMMIVERRIQTYRDARKIYGSTGG